jgi:hypothetical protein
MIVDRRGLGNDQVPARRQTERARQIHIAKRATGREIVIGGERRAGQAQQGSGEKRSGQRVTSSVRRE